MLMMFIYWLESYMEKNTEALLVDSNEISLEVNADKTKYIVITRVRMQNEVTIYRLIKLL
jgi:hypothetical protein